MPRIVSVPSRGVEVEFPDSLPDSEIDAYLAEKYPRSGEDVANEVEQANSAFFQGGDRVNSFLNMSRDDFVLYQNYLAKQKTSLGDALGIAGDAFGTIIGEVGDSLAATGEAALEGKFSPAAKSAGQGIVAGTLGLADVAAKIIEPAEKIPSKEEFLKSTKDQPAETIADETFPFSFGRKQVPNTEEDYNALIDRQKQRAADAVDRVYDIESILRGAPIPEIARGAQYIDPTTLASLGGSALAKFAGQSLFKTAATTGIKSTTKSAAAQTALRGLEKAAKGVETVASLPGKVVQGVKNVAETVAPGTGAAMQGGAVATALMSDAGLTAGVLGGATTAEKAAEVAGAAARAARQEASRVGLLERAAQDATISPAAQKLAAGLAQIQPAISTAGRVSAQALKEAGAGAAVGAGLGYLAERNIEGAAAGAGAGAAIGGMSGSLRSGFDLGKEVLGYSTSRTQQKAIGDLNSFLGERPDVEQAAWGTTLNRLVQQVGPEKAASQIDALKVAEANGAKIRVATPDEIKQWQNPGWVDTDNVFDLVLNPELISSDTASHETAHVLFKSVINRAFRPEIETAIFGLADPVTGEIVRPGLLNDVELAKVADQISASYGDNTKAANNFKGYANVLRNSTDANSLQIARSSIADEMAASYTGNLFNRIRPGRFNPDRLPLVYRKALNALEDSILDKFRTVLFEKGMELGFDAPSRTFRDTKGKPIRVPELDAIVKRAFENKKKRATEAQAKPDLIPAKPADRVIWAKSYGGARGILNDDGTPKSEQQINAEAMARWQDMTQRLAALPENERKGIEFNRDKTGKTVMTAKGQISPTAANAILDSGMLDQSAKAVLRDVLMSLQNPNKSTFDTRYYGVYTRGKGKGKMVAGVKSASQNEILPYSVELNSKDGVLIRAVDMTKVRDRLVTSLAKPQFKQLYSNPADALKDLGRYMENITQINPIDSATLLGGGEKGAKKRNLFYETLGFRLRNGESLVNAPESIINKSQDTIKSYRAERFAKLVNSGHAFAFEEATTYERAMRNFQPNAFNKETLPAGETLTNPDGYRILKKTGSKLFRVYDDKGELIGTTSTEQSAMRKGQADFIKKSAKEEKRFQPISPEQDTAYLSAVKAGDTEKAQRMVDEAAKAAGYGLNQNSKREVELWAEKIAHLSRDESIALKNAERAEEALQSGISGALARVARSSLERHKSKASQARKEINLGQPPKTVFRGDASQISVYRVKDGGRSIWAADSAEVAKTYGNNVIRTFLQMKNPLVFDAKGATFKTLEFEGNRLDADDLSSIAKDRGYDGLIIRNFYDSNTDDGGNVIADHFTVFNPSQIKSADPVTRDESGNVIPLSQRFNPESSDIRFQPDPASTSVLNGQNGSRIVVSPSGKFRVYNATGKLLGIRDTEEAAKKLASKQ